MTCMMDLVVVSGATESTMRGGETNCEIFDELIFVIIISDLICLNDK